MERRRARQLAGPSHRPPRRETWVPCLPQCGRHRRPFVCTQMPATWAAAAAALAASIASSGAAARYRAAQAPCGPARQTANPEARRCSGRPSRLGGAAPFRRGWPRRPFRSEPSARCSLSPYPGPRPGPAAEVGAPRHPSPAATLQCRAAQAFGAPIRGGRSTAPAAGAPLEKRRLLVHQVEESPCSRLTSRLQSRRNHCRHWADQSFLPTSPPMPRWRPLQWSDPGCRPALLFGIYTSPIKSSGHRSPRPPHGRRADPPLAGRRQRPRHEAC
mmetsp:Transcript_171177/g.548715  ORF Transcript_171177/g.548715 Transcript_171177/m.548715 type:complete len:273 (-) Transcript_171177:77-895(-)